MESAGDKFPTFFYDLGLLSMTHVLKNTANHLLSALTEDEFARLLPSLEVVSLTSKMILYDVDQEIPYIYFPLNAVVSLISMVGVGRTVEVAMVGREGLVGVPVFLGSSTTSERAVVQIAGEAARITAELFQQQSRMLEAFHNLLLRYTHGLLGMVALSAACNTLHPLDGRLCRWLLMVHDRVLDSEFKIDQQAMSEMLGVKRPTLSTTAKMLQKAGLISCSRGRVRILNREGLEAGVCQCYFVMRNQFNRLIDKQLH